MSMIELYVQCMKDGNNVGLADLFSERGVLHDTSVIRAGVDVIHLEGRMAIEMMFHHKFGFNGGPFKIHGVSYKDSNTVSYFTVSYTHLDVYKRQILDLIQRYLRL